MADFIIPIVNMNGTSRENLLQQYIDALEGLRHAIRTLGAMAPHGRDYQTQPGLYQQARVQYEAMIAPVHKAYLDLSALAEQFASSGR
jgi:hypothetical protein